MRDDNMEKKTRTRKTFCDVQVSLLVTAPNLNGGFVTQVLEAEPTSEIDKGRYPDFRDGQPFWILSSQVEPDTDPVKAIESFLTELLRKRSQLDQLTETGHLASIDISGRAETQQHLYLPPEVLRLLGDTGMPVSVTVLSDAVKDDMAWLTEGR
ncbi:DUF4279 domain-containing protein [Streptomyces sp. 549]|uniref:DUF4279 domain-containing protein n=1 Tax=Streptomyces sp. 549 TaxID=3049076 RepID=UPI0024C3F8E8|nr:DUF4279 domain-containing protein [Streptomyces sp. 549]MDK1473073.1 DUF4279 domain-containing protein [Streptomyces sp. 549]